eukprot:jgi/Psemu1/26639/gm1.26639_g
MPETDFDCWNSIQEIEIRFGKFSSKGNADKHEDLSNAFSQYLENTDGLFTTNDDEDGSKTLAPPDLVTMLKEIIINTIMDILPFKEQTEINKGHISTLFANVAIWQISPNKSVQRIINKNSMDKGRQQAIKDGQDTILLEIRPTNWGNLIVDSAFRVTTGQLHCIVQNPTDPDTPEAILLNSEATALCQLSEWGMRMIQGQFPQLKDKLLLKTFWRSEGHNELGDFSILNVFMHQTDGCYYYANEPTEDATSMFE